MKTTARLVLAVVWLVALATAGATTLHAAAPTLGATVQSRIWTGDDPVLRVLNASDIAERFDFAPSGGWKVEPPSLVVAPHAKGSVMVAGDGSDGSKVTITVSSTAPVPPNASPNVIHLTTVVYHVKPFDWAALLAQLFLGLLALAAVAFLAWRLRPWEFRLHRSHH